MFPEGMANPFDFGDAQMPPAPQPQQPGMFPGMPPAPTPPLPEQVASYLGNKNVSPQEFLQNPLAFIPKIGPTGGATDVGGALDPMAPQAAPGTPLPTPDPRKSSGAGTDPAGLAAGKSQLLSTLQGLKAPAAPVPQKVSTPNSAVPGPHGSIKGGNLIALLTALGGQVPTTKIPLSIGATLGGAR